MAWHGKLWCLTHGKQARDNSELRGEVKLFPQQVALGEFWLVVKIPWIQVIFVNSLSWVHEVSVLPNLSLTSSLYIAPNSNPELYLTPGPAPKTASADLYQNENEVVVLMRLLRQTRRGGGARDPVITCQQKPVVPSKWGVLDFVVLLWLFFWPKNTFNQVCLYSQACSCSANTGVCNALI